ncbi:MAG: FAD-binding oxidoreductase, partial [Desulfobacterales bacterium]|nr:FAD-binding oxidoreductase [Desulfobacterales bacterium]
MSKEPKKIVIAGAGVTGCSIAYHLAKMGIPCTLIERESIAERASGKAWAMSGYPFGWHSVEEDPSTYFHNPNPETGVRNWMDLYASGYYRQRDIALEIQQIAGVDAGYQETQSTFLLPEEEMDAI